MVRKTIPIAIPAMSISTTQKTISAAVGFGINPLMLATLWPKPITPTTKSTRACHQCAKNCITSSIIAGIEMAFSVVTSMVDDWINYTAKKAFYSVLAKEDFESRFEADLQAHTANIKEEIESRGK